MIGIQVGGLRFHGIAKQIVVSSLSGYTIRRIDQRDGGVVLHIKRPEGRLIIRLRFNHNQWKQLTKP